MSRDVKTAILYVRLPVALAGEIRAEAARLGISMADYVNLVMRGVVPLPGRTVTDRSILAAYERETGGPGERANLVDEPASE